MAHLLEGKPIADAIYIGLKHRLALLKDAPRLVSIQVGENPAVASYVQSQKRAAESIGIVYQSQLLPCDSSEADTVDFIRKLNQDPAVCGIIVQMPLPGHLVFAAVTSAIDPSKDVEGINSCNIGRLVVGAHSYLPCTPAAAMELIVSSGVELRGAEAVVVGGSRIVGKPIALMLLEKMATVTVCHIATSEAGKLQEHAGRADVLIVAVGKPGVMKGGWIKEGAVVIDIGINRQDGRIVGDVEFAEASRRAAFITPVPGGVGPLTVAMLMRNVVTAAVKNADRKQ